MPVQNSVHCPFFLVVVDYCSIRIALAIVIALTNNLFGCLRTTLFLWSVMFVLLFFGGCSSFYPANYNFWQIQLLFFNFGFDFLISSMLCFHSFCAVLRFVSFQSAFGSRKFFSTWLSSLFYRSAVCWMTSGLISRLNYSLRTIVTFAQLG